MTPAANANLPDTPGQHPLPPGLSRCTACAPAPGTQSLPVIDDPSGDGSSYLFRVDTAATPERLLLPAPALEALVFKPVVDQIMREAREMLQDALRTNTAVDKVRALTPSMCLGWLLVLCRTHHGIYVHSPCDTRPLGPEDVAHILTTCITMLLRGNKSISSSRS